MRMAKLFKTGTIIFVRDYYICVICVLLLPSMIVYKIYREELLFLRILSEIFKHYFLLFFKIFQPLFFHQI